MFKYNDDEIQINKVIKMNQDRSTKLLKDDSSENTYKNADLAIESSEKLLRSLGYDTKIDDVKKQNGDIGENSKVKNTPILSSWEQIVKQAEEKIPFDIYLEDLLTQEELDRAVTEYQEINHLFAGKTSITNKIDLQFLALATALQVAKSLLFPLIGNDMDYGNPFASENRLKHDDKSIKREQKERNNRFKSKKLQHSEVGYWIDILYQGVPYDAILGAKNLGLGFSGMNHRLHTLGHDPILGWVIGTANILTDTITIRNFTSYRIRRTPTRITSEMVSMPTLFSESYEVIKAHRLNLPAAIFTQAQHFKSDVFTKQGLPIPVLTLINEDFASELYMENYDTLCLARDTEILGASAIISGIFDLIIGLVHGLFRDEKESKALYEMRTRKILLISNSIATTSTIVATCISQNPKTLDIGSLLITVSHLFTDIGFMAKLKQEFIQQEIDSVLKEEINKIDRLYESL